MVIIVTKTKTFSRGIVGDVKTVSPGPAPVTVPDWVRDTPTFKLGSQDGSCVEILIQPPVTDDGEEVEEAEAVETHATTAAPSALRRKRKTT